MPLDPQEAIRRLNSLKERVKQATTAAAGAKVHYEQAQADLETAREQAEELGLDLDDEKGFERWLDKEAGEIEALIEKANLNLERTAEAVRG